MLTNDNTESRRVVEHCFKRHKSTLNPIIEWSDSEVWEFIRAHGIHYCCLYDEGFIRLGCIGCPNARKRGREKQFLRWPKYLGSYLKAFERMLHELKKRPDYFGSWRYANAIDIYNWWMEYDVLPGQIPIEGFDYEL